MTTFDKVFNEENQILIHWTSPRFLPDYYLHIVSCNLLCDPATYYLFEKVSNKQTNSTAINGIYPGSTCLFKHIAVYNPASIDPGIGLSALTFYSGKFQKVSFDMHIVSTRIPWQ